MTFNGCAVMRVEPELIYQGIFTGELVAGTRYQHSLQLLSVLEDIGRNISSTV